MNIPCSAVMLTALLFVGGSAASAWATQNVSSPVVDAGKWSAEIRSGWQRFATENRFRLRQHLDYGFNDALALRVISQQRYRSQVGTQYAETGLELRWQWLELQDSGWAAGMRLGYDVTEAAIGADELKWRLLGLWKEEAVEYRLNLDVGHEVGPGSESGLQFGTRMQAIYAWEKGIRTGLELFSDYGNLSAQSGWDAQRHQLGPVAKFAVLDGINLQLGFLAGLTDASPDSEVKFILGWSW